MRNRSLALATVAVVVLSPAIASGKAKPKTSRKPTKKSTPISGQSSGSTSSTSVVPVTTISTATTTAVVVPKSACDEPSFPVPRVGSVVLVPEKTLRFDLDGWVRSESPARKPIFLVLSLRDLSITTPATSARGLPQSNIAPGTKRFEQASGEMTAKRFERTGANCDPVDTQTFPVSVNVGSTYGDGTLTDLSFVRPQLDPMTPGNLYIDPSTKSSEIFRFLSSAVQFSDFKAGAPWPIQETEHRITVNVSDGGANQTQLTNGVKGGIVVATSTAISVSAPAGTGSVSGTGVSKLVLRFSASPV
jgi:hypothetical protein